MDMDKTICFTAVEFPDDPNVAGLKYWYLCPFCGAEAGVKVSAPLGRHNRLQEGVIREVRFAEEDGAPYPVNLIKRIAELHL